MSALKDAKPQAIKMPFKDGVVHELQFTLNALALLEEKYGSVDAAFEALDKGSFIAIRYLLWAATQHEEKPLTESEVGNLIDVTSMGSIMEALGNALSDGLPTEEQVKELSAPANGQGVDPNK